MEVAMISCGKTLSPPLPCCFSPTTSSPVASASSPSSTTTAPPLSARPSPPPPPAAAGGATTPQQVVLSPCAACKILRRRCADKCVLAPYFPPTDPLKFTVAHKVFGASNIIKLLQELPESQRADAVSSMVYEANARLRDPVYGSAGAICNLQKQVSELQAELAKAQAELANMKCQQANVLAMLCMQMTGSNPSTPTNPTDRSRHHLPMISSPSSPLQGHNDHSQLHSPFSDGLLNFYDDDSNCSLSWELL